MYEEAIEIINIRQMHKINQVPTEGTLDKATTAIAESGKGRFFSSPPHTTPHAQVGPHGAVPGKF
jgi:hypothetical protein